MDFTYHYSEAQESFRKEVSAWLDANLPNDLDDAVKQASKAPATDPRRLLGEKGWLAPTEPVEYGGIGASQGEEVILAEELDRRGLGWLLDRGTAALTRALDRFGSQSQSTHLITAINQGKVSIWHTCIPPEDSLEDPPASNETPPDPMRVIASQDGDDYVLNGQAWFSGSDPTPGYLWTLAYLHAELPPGGHSPDTTISLLVPAGLEGIATRSTRRLVDGGPRQVDFDQVRVPRSCLLGPKGEGWSLMHSALNAAAQTAAPATLDAGVVRLLHYAGSATRQGLPLIQEPVVQQMVMDAYIDGRVARLFQLRDAWLRANGQKTTYQPAQTRMWRRRAAQRYARTVRQVLGVYSLLDEEDPRSPAQGKFELQQRQSLVSNDPVGVSGSDADIIARHLGMAGGERSGAQP